MDACAASGFGVLWGTGFADVDAVFGLDELAGLMWTEEGVGEMEHAELGSGSGAELRSGLALTGLFGGMLGSDPGSGTGVFGALAGVIHAWWERAGVQGSEAGLGAEKVTGSEGAGGYGVGEGGEVEREHVVGVQEATELWTLTVVWEDSAGRAEG